MKDAFAEIIGYMLFFGCVVTALMLHGCTNKLADISIAPAPAKSCPTLVMPPVGQDCLLDIQGDKITANDCGDTLLRGYVQARSLLRPAASAK